MFRKLWCWDTDHGIQLTSQFGTVLIERQIVNIVPERVLELITDSCETKDDVCRGNGAWDCDPAESLVKLERQEVHVEKHDL